MKDLSFLFSFDGAVAHSPTGSLLWNCIWMQCITIIEAFLFTDAELSISSNINSLSGASPLTDYWWISDIVVLKHEGDVTDVNMEASLLISFLPR